MIVMLKNGYANVMNAVCTYIHIDFTDDVLLSRSETQPTQYGRDTTQISSWGVCAKLSWQKDEGNLDLWQVTFAIPRLQAETAWGPVPISPTWALAPQGGWWTDWWGGDFWHHRVCIGLLLYGPSVIPGCWLLAGENWKDWEVWIWVVGEDETYTFQAQAVATMTNKINRLSVEVI